MSEFEGYETYRATIATEIEARIQEHRIALQTAGTDRLHLLAEGDSWFDYPVPEGPMARTDVVAHLAASPAPPPLILSLAHWGDATTQMLGLKQRDRLIKVLKEFHAGPRPFDAILFSGGGNDVVGDTFSLWLNDAPSAAADPDEAINGPALDAVLGVVRAAYLDLLALRDRYAPGVRVFTHGYDFAPPTNKGVCLVGPWLFPSLQARGWMADTSPLQLSRGEAIVTTILTRFNAMLNELADRDDANLVVVPTQGTLDPASDWANELHPNRRGFGKIAAKFRTALAANVA